MDSRSGIQWSIAFFFVAVGFSSAVFAGPTFIYGGDFDMLIPANPDDTRGWMDDAVIKVPDHFTIYDLDVRISITHTNVFDLQIFLQSPGPDGTTLCLNMYNPDNEFFEGADYSQTVFDDEALTHIGNAEPPFTGRFRPIEPFELTEFYGEDAYGLWRLQIYDAYHYNTGNLDSFEVMITIPEPTTARLLALGAGLTILFRPRRRR
jgi:subtilisin-like proprotein convertase family protein